MAQVPLTVSPFVSLPTAVTLPYTYKSLPATLPPSSTGETNGTEKPRYVVSSTGHSAHPDDIIASCQALQKHLQTLQEDAERALKDWEQSIKERELAEKRRVAPGWLDSDEKILEPARAAENTAGAKRPDPAVKDLLTNEPPQPTASNEGEELDRAFGSMGLR